MELPKEWTYWFQPQDLKVPADDFDVVALILRWSGEIRLADGIYR